MRISTTLASVSAMYLLMSTRAAADEVNLVTDATTSIFSVYPDNNFGESNLVIGSNSGRVGASQPGRALVHFDLSSIPAGAVITSATLTMTVVKVPPPDAPATAHPSNFDLYPMLDPWTAGTGGGNAGRLAFPGETTWNELGADGIASWGSPGGQIGTDFAGRGSDGQLDSDSPDTSASVGINLGPISFGSTSQFVADVQSWLDDPANNFGAIIISDGEGTPGTARRLASLYTADSSDPAPTLTVDYELPTPEPSTGILLAVGILYSLGRRPTNRARSSTTITSI
jgi:hypothetical protein